MRVPYRPQTMEVGQLILRWLFIRGQPLVDEVESFFSSGSSLLLPPPAPPPQSRQLRSMSLLGRSVAGPVDPRMNNRATHVPPQPQPRCAACSSIVQQSTYAHLYLLYNAEQSDKQSARHAAAATVRLHAAAAGRQPSSLLIRTRLFSW